MTTGHIARNGQIAVPKAVLKNSHVRPGDTIAIETEPDGCIWIYPNALTASDVAGMLKT